MATARLRSRLLERALGAAIGVTIAVTGAACDGKRLGLPQKDAEHGTAMVGGAVVSTVDGHPITVDEVEELVRAGLSPREALDRLQAERLLMSDAERRGFGKLPSVALIGEQARVQALLEAEAAAVTISDEDLRAAYEKNKQRFEKPERRASVHVLANLPPKPTPQADAAAKAFAERMLGELAFAADVDAFIAAQAQKPSPPEFKIVAEKIPPADREGKTLPLLEPYLAALFSVSKPGVAAAPAHTKFGWHAVRVTEIVPAEKTPLDEAYATLRGEMLLARRKERVRKLVEELRGTYRVEIPADVGQTLAKLAL
jgi:parvulin-like peptidyl-prolyl isomerase